MASTIPSSWKFVFTKKIFGLGSDAGEVVLPRKGS